MADNDISATRTALVAPTRPTITVPQRPHPLDASGLLGGGVSLSPGPLTLVSSLFAEKYPEPTTWEHQSSFSQLLAGAMASPTARPIAFLGGLNPIDGLSKDAKLRDLSEKRLCFDQLSPLFTIPLGFSPSGLLSSPWFFSPPSHFGVSHQQALAQVTAQASSTEFDFQQQPLEYLASQMPPVTSSLQVPAADSFELSHTDIRNHLSYVANIDRPADDGYNWRKYGQKPIKGCEFPRSYYKCTHANCPVKKKVERSSDGQITQIIYKGQHNHDKPQNRRGRDSYELSRFGLGGTAVSGGIMEMHQMGDVQVTESSDGEEGGNRQSAEDDDQDYDDDDGNGGATKIRKTEGESGVSMSHRIVTEPKIIVQTRSEVDLLDDGYKWRKYGQKVVKGNPHPRSYYKCTTGGCTVRKHIERASTDPKAVLTAYEGKHNHDVPAARASSSSQLKPRKAESGNHSLLKDMNFGTGGQRSVLLHLKEENFTV